MYVSKYMYMYNTHIMYMYIHIHVSMYMYWCTCTVNVHACIKVHVYMHMCISMYNMCTCTCIMYYMYMHMCSLCIHSIPPYLGTLTSISDMPVAQNTLGTAAITMLAYWLSNLVVHMMLSCPVDRGTCPYLGCLDNGGLSVHIYVCPFSWWYFS